MGLTNRSVPYQMPSRTMIIAVILAFMMAVHAIPVDLQLDKDVALDGEGYEAKDNDGKPCEIGHNNFEEKCPRIPEGCKAIPPFQKNGCLVCRTFECPDDNDGKDDEEDKDVALDGEGYPALDNDGKPCEIGYNNFDEKCGSWRERPEGCKVISPSRINGCLVCRKYECPKSCTDTPTAWMKKNGKSCDSWKYIFKNKCNHDAHWMKNKYCQQSCFLNGAGYDGDICKR